LSLRLFGNHVVAHESLKGGTGEALYPLRRTDTHNEERTIIFKDSSKQEEAEQVYHFIKKWYLFCPEKRIAARAYFLYMEDRASFDEIIARMRAMFPGLLYIQPIELVKAMSAKYFLEGVYEHSSKVPLSEGTLRAFDYLLLMRNPTETPLLCFAEPEQKIYPAILPILGDEFKRYTDGQRGGQAFVSTYSPEFLNTVDIESVFYLYQKKGVTQVYRAKNSPQLNAYMEAGDKMGRLWTQGIIEGEYLQHF
jgi:predicted ATPase